MWKSMQEKEPLIIDSKDWSKDEFAAICKLFRLDSERVKQIVLRETYSYEYHIDIQDNN